MDKGGFSFPTEQDRREIKSIAREIFNGRRSPEIFQDYGQWIPYVADLYLPICDTETGSLQMMPFPGSLVDQPYMTMQIIYAVQGEYRAHLAAKVEKLKAGNKSGNRKYSPSRYRGR